ncbi:MAG: GvpL/GvpF family gas vesicle protein [Alphaproteobacteria bacterium]|nr:GvpL/GvpF family gas vesicle protein [Alphaproteobacteria bacterium]
MLHVYAIVDSVRFGIIPGEGHEAGDIVPAPCGAFAAAVSASSAGAIAPTPQNVWRHERVLERLMRDHTVLPLRFGTICRDADALKEYVLGSADLYRNDLGRVRGKVEIALRIADRVPSVQTGEPVAAEPDAANDHEPAGRGAAYLRTRLQRLRNDTAREGRGKELEQLLRRHLGALLKDVLCAPRADSAAGYAVSCLVERDGVAAFSGALNGFRGKHPQFEITCTGPWAPYSFVAMPPFSGGAP